MNIPMRNISKFLICKISWILASSNYYVLTKAIASRYGTGCEELTPLFRHKAEFTLFDNMNRLCKWQNLYNFLSSYFPRYLFAFLRVPVLKPTIQPEVRQRALQYIWMLNFLPVGRLNKSFVGESESYSRPEELPEQSLI